MRPICVLFALFACDDTAKIDDSSAPDDSVAADDSAGSTENSQCLDNLDRVAELYPDAGELGDCSGAGAVIADSLMNLAGVTIDNEGQTQSPCVQVRCDADYAYVTSNDLPFYDFVPITPNPLVETAQIYRIPLVTAPVAAELETDELSSLDACVDAYNSYLSDPDGATSREPSYLCTMEDADTKGLIDPATGETVHKIQCLNHVAMLIGGTPVFGPNEGHVPFAFGNPGYWYPLEQANDSYYQGMTTALDLCGFHTSDQGHNHAANEACFDLDDDNRPVHSYVDVYESWDFEAAIDGACAEESGIVGWSFDGYPIKGPCVCTARDDGGDCTEIKRARSSWHYAGLEQWSDHAGASADVDGLLDQNGADCDSDADCCPEGEADCEYACHIETFADADAPGGSVVAKRCVLHDYSWCNHAFTDHSDEADEADFAPLDVCNGYEGPDGYAYHATMTFPFFQACYRGQPSDSVGGAAL